MNFIAPIPRDHLEDLATAALEANSQQSIAKVIHGVQTNHCIGARRVQIYDQYLDFITLEDELFCLRQVGRESVSYYGECVARERRIGRTVVVVALNRPQMIDVEMDQLISTIVDSLFSVCVTLGTKEV